MPTQGLQPPCYNNTRKLAEADLDDMGVPDLVDLWQQCDRDDPESGRVVAAYLDRAHPDWREGEEGVSQDGGGPTPFGVMDRAQALQVLGLVEGATAADVKTTSMPPSVVLTWGGPSSVSAALTTAAAALLPGDLVPKRVSG